MIHGFYSYNNCLSHFDIRMWLDNNVRGEHTNKQKGLKVTKTDQMADRQIGGIMAKTETERGCVQGFVNDPHYA